MATIADDNIPTARRLPPPCWSPEETVALIDAYKSKWYSLRRGNLRANHWQDVADAVAARCSSSPPKTAVQCRHKMEKLRKRYRAEIQRAAAARGGGRRFTSSWVHFQRMHAMEKGPNPTPPSSSSSSSGDDDSYNHSQKFNSGNQRSGFGADPAAGVRLKFPGQATGGRSYPQFDRISPNPNLFPNAIGGRNGSVISKAINGGFSSRSGMRKRGNEMMMKNGNGEDEVGDVVGAIRALGDGFMRVEKAKMDVMRQVEEMRMDMELKRTEMILDSQQRMVEAFAKAMSSERSGKGPKGNSTMD